MQEIVVEDNTITVKYINASYWAVFSSGRKAYIIGQDLKKDKISEEDLLNSSLKFKKI